MGLMKKPDDLNVYESELATFWFDENGILCSRSKAVTRTVAKQKSTYALIRQITDNRKVCLFSDMRNSALVLQDDKTREYIAREMPKLFIAMAVESESTLEKVGPTIFLNTMNEPIPIRMFSDEHEAKEWLKSFL